MVLVKCQAKKESLKANKKTDLGISLKMTSSLCKMKSKFTIGVKSTANYTHLLYILLTVMEIFNAILFVSSLMISTTIHILFIKHKQSLLITLKRTFQMWIRSCISLTAVLINIIITKTFLICVIISKISIGMLNGYSLQLVMPSHHVMVLGDLLNVMLQNIVYKGPNMTNIWASNQCLIYVSEKKISSITFFGVSQEEMVNVCADLEDCFAKSKIMPAARSSHHFVPIYCIKIAHKLISEDRELLQFDFNKSLTEY